MLILTRRVGETINIGSHIEVTVLGVKGSQVRLGVKAPADTIIDRSEVAERRAAGEFTSPRPVRVHLVEP